MGAKVEWDDKGSVLAAIRAYPIIFEDELLHAMETAGEIIVGAVREKTPSNDGILKASINASAPARVMTGIVVSIGDPTEYGETIEYGRKPGSRMPPPDSLVPWVWAHRQYFKNVETEEDAAGVALMVARKIKARGFSSAPDGPGKGWGMYQKAAAEDGRAYRQVLAVFRAAKRRIVQRCERGS